MKARKIIIVMSIEKKGTFMKCFSTFSLAKCLSIILSMV